VEQAERGGPADEAGMHGSSIWVDVKRQRLPPGGDAVTALDGQPVTRMEDLQTFLQLA
jgi:hypothetical protein